MKLIKLERIQLKTHPIVRITYKSDFGRVKIRDAMKVHNYWHFVDTNEIISGHTDYINKFIDNELDIYVVNEQTFIPSPPRQLSRIIKEDKH